MSLMAQSSDLERGSFLVWHTEKPYVDKLRKSASFSLRGSEWNLQMKYFSRQNNYGTNYYYALSLHQGTKTENLEESLQFRVTTFIEDKDKFPRRCNSKIVKRTDEVLEECEKSSFTGSIPGFESYGGLKIICLFHDFQPSMLQIKNETAHLSTQTDGDLPALVYSSPHLESLSLDFSKLLKDQSLPDVKLICRDRTFFAHKSVLAARSQVIADKLRKGMGECEIAITVVTNLDADILELLLKYVYSGKLPDLSEVSACSLYEAGDKYAISGLKKACSDWMIRGLTKDNYARFLTVADVYNDAAFKDGVVSFIKQHL